MSNRAHATKTFSDEIHAEKYRGNNESFREWSARVANALKDNDEHFDRLRDVLLEQRFLPGGRVQAAMGSPRAITAFNCYVMPTIQDTFVDGEDSIMDVARKAAQTMRMGGGVGYDFCLAPDTLILKSDLTWEKVSNLEKDDELVAFDEELNLTKNTFKRSKVLENKKVTQPTYVVRTNRGNVTASADHFWVVRRAKNFPFKKKGQGYKWVKTKDLKKDDQIAFTTEPWEIQENCWLSGILDGEGNKLCGKTTKSSYVKSIEFIGEQELWATETETKTLIANGFLSHNSTLRPRGDLITKLQSKSSGPLSFMEIYDAVCRATMSAGHRRGAQMGVLRIDHPDVEEFIRAKQNRDRLTGFNISLAVTDKFMKAVTAGADAFELSWGGRTYSEVDPANLWEEIMRSTWNWAEPGVLFIDRINKMNNLHYCETIAATNPCGEQPLPPNGACLLGSFNLVKYIHRDGRGFDWDMLANDVETVVPAMDNVVDRTKYPLVEQREEAKNKRRMGLGVTGLANALEILGHVYGSASFLEQQAQVMGFITNRCYVASADVAGRKEPFPLYEPDAYMEGGFVRTLEPTTRDTIYSQGIRNSHLTSIAPTGTISLAAGNVSSGIEPPYALEFTRTVKEFDGEKQVAIMDYAWGEHGVRGKTATEATLDEHLAVLATAQCFIDSACSKTINVDPSTPWEEFKAVYTKAWELGTKGVTTFNPGGKRMGILTETASEEEGAACRIDPETGTRTCDE